MPARLILVVLVVILGGIGLYIFSQREAVSPSPTPLSQDSKETSAKSTTSSSAKGVVIIESPTKGQEIKSPLTVTGLVYGNNGTLTIKLKQKEGGMYVTEDKVVKISGKSDNISFAEAMMFGLPAMPQPGILEVIYKDNNDQGLDDKVSIEVNFPSDLGRGE